MFDVDKEIALFAVSDTDIPQDISEKDKRAKNLYNDAVVDIQTGNEDIANIKLKKAISIMPDFYRAKLILGLYFMKIEQLAKAKNIFDDVLQNSKEFGESALRYIRVINVHSDKKNKPKPEEEKEQKEKANLILGIKSFGKTAFLLAGLFLGILISIPFILSVAKQEPVNFEPENEVVGSLENEISDLMDIQRIRENKIDELENDVKQLESLLEKAKETTAPIITEPPVETTSTDGSINGEISDEFEEYLQIMRLYRNNQILEAADRMKAYITEPSIQDSEYMDDIKEMHDELMAAAARFCEDAGVWFFEQGRYRDALLILEKATYYLPGYTRMYRVNYYMGRSLFGLEEYESAKEKFQLVIAQAPNDDWIMYANLRLDEINELYNNEN